jgi:hypothetical protein
MTPKRTKKVPRPASYLPRPVHMLDVLVRDDYTDLQDTLEQVRNLDRHSSPALPLD